MRGDVCVGSSGADEEKLLGKRFDTIFETILKGTIENLQYNESHKIATN
jgi:hypothetical protein